MSGVTCFECYICSLLCALIVTHFDCFDAVGGQQGYYEGAAVAPWARRMNTSRSRGGEGGGDIVIWRDMEEGGGVAGGAEAACCGTG
jgi:hypothetical protein